jgi:hypothetical protein
MRYCTYNKETDVITETFNNIEAAYKKETTSLAVAGIHESMSVGDYASISWKAQASEATIAYYENLSSNNDWYDDNQG